MLSRYIWVICC